MESAPAMEIDMDAFGDFFLMIPTAGWKAKNAFHTYRQALRRLIDRGVPNRGPKPCLLDRNRKRRRTLSRTSPPLAGFEVIIVGRF